MIVTVHCPQVYKGYVDDPRNTDNSWMETVAMNFHDEAGDSAGRFRLHAGECWIGSVSGDSAGRSGFTQASAGLVVSLATALAG